MALSFGEHGDVLFAKAPLESVLCQLRFSPILAHLDAAGISGFQTAIRDEYPETEEEVDAAMSVGPQGASLQRSAPVWRFADFSGAWRASIGVDFVALENTDAAAYSFDEFGRRLTAVLAAVDRTVHPGRSKRVGLRKVNVFEHPDVRSIKGWRGFLSDDLIGLSGADDMPDDLSGDYAEAHFKDGEGGTLSIRHGADPQDATKYRLDLDYWNELSFDFGDQSAISEVLRAYADSMTAFFHRCLKEPMYRYLEPRPRDARA